MGGFSRHAAASARVPCTACCRADQAGDDELSRAGAVRIATLTGGAYVSRGVAAPASAAGAPDGRSESDCAQRARALAPILARFDSYREALPSARAAADMNELGDQSGDRPSDKPCLTRLPVRADALNAALGLKPGTLVDGDLRDDATGFRAALYRDEGTGRMILVPRDTQPDSLVDWQANIRNGLGIDTPQYKAMRALSSRLSANDQAFDIAGYSKGGGLAQEGGLVSAGSQVRVFNSAGLTAASLARTAQTDFDGLAARTRLFSSEGDFLTFMNDTTDPAQNILNARYLRSALSGGDSLVAPIDIKTANPAMRGRPDPAFAAQKAAYMGELDEHIDALQSAYDRGDVVAGFPPVRAASRETIAGSETLVGDLLGAGDGQPNLGKLNQHRMQVVLGAMERDVDTDRLQVQAFLRRCG